MNIYASSQDIIYSTTTALESYGKTNLFMSAQAKHFYSITNRSSKPKLYQIAFQNCPDGTGCAYFAETLTINNGETRSGELFSSSPYRNSKAGTYKLLARTNAQGIVSESTSNIIVSD
jgi:hypothetical protein